MKLQHRAERTERRVDAPNPDFHGGVMHIPRSRGAISGMLLVVFGAWAALVPFIGPLFDYAYTPDHAWRWTAARGWLEVLPGAVAAVCGLVLILTANRLTASTAAWLAVAAGAWLVIGRDVATWWHIGSPGRPASMHASLRALESLGMFSGIGALIVFVAAGAVGRLSIRSVRDVRAAQAHERKVLAQRRSVQDAAYQAGRRDAVAEREQEQAAQQPAAQPAQPVPATMAGHEAHQAHQAHQATVPPEQQQPGLRA